MNHSALLEMGWFEGLDCSGLAVALRYLHRDLATVLNCRSVWVFACMEGYIVAGSAGCWNCCLSYCYLSWSQMGCCFATSRTRHATSASGWCLPIQRRSKLSRLPLCKGSPSSVSARQLKVLFGPGLAVRSAERRQHWQPPGAAFLFRRLLLLPLLRARGSG